MAFNSANILAGPARIFIGVTAPASGLPPTWVTHTNGVPATGTEVGYTENQVEFMYKAEKVEISPEQSYMPVDVFLKGEISHIVFTAMERTYIALQRAFDNVYSVNDGTRSGFAFGNGTAIITPTLGTVFFSSPQRRNAGKYSIGMLYKTYSMDGVKLPFTKTKPMTYQITLTALADETRTAGDQGGQFYIET